MDGVYNGFCGYVREILYPRFLELAAEKGVDITMDELESKFNLSRIPAATKSRRKTEVPDQGCEYKFTRGRLKNIKCGKPRQPGGLYCSTCSRKGAVKNHDIPSEPSQQDIQLNVMPYDEANGLYRESEHDIIIKQVSDSSAYYIGKLEKNTNKIIELTHEEKQLARSLGLNDPAVPSVSKIPALQI
jgi:hypothetical protein